METPERKPLQNVNINTQLISIPPSPFMKSLGYGTGVNVYRLERSPTVDQIRSPWAVKRVSQRTRETSKEHSKVFNERIIKEAEILKKLDHPNIIGFRAIAQGGDGADSLVLECCSTSLGALLEERLDDKLGMLPANNIKTMICDISNALNYLHTKAMILHGDLKSHNILVKGDFEACKLCDFGVSLPLDKNGQINFKKNPNLEYVGTVLWLAPEVVNEQEIISSKADIFSFGLIIYETIALTPPHVSKCEDETSVIELESSTEQEASVSVCSADSQNVSTNSKSFNDSENAEGYAAYGTRPCLPHTFELHHEYNVIIELFFLCTNTDPGDRPTAKLIFEGIKQNMK